MTTRTLGLPRGRELNREDMKAMPDDGHLYELLDGTLIVTPMPRIIHQVIQMNLPGVRITGPWTRTARRVTRGRGPR
jgi:hypothetical protein